MTCWVVGGGGFLGSHLARALPDSWSPSVRFDWGSPQRLAAQMAEAAEAFAAQPGPRTVCWCAGAGVVGTPAADLARETAALETLLGAVHGGADRLLLSSSAGGVYGGTPGDPLTEDSECRPVSDYGRAKLEQERRVRDWAGRNPRAAVLIARISNLYGPGQNLAKPQGLVSQLCRSLVRRRPLNLFVPIDTLRDPLYVADAAAHLAACLRRMGTPGVTVKIFASGESVSIAAILGILARVAKVRAPVVCGQRRDLSEQPRRLRFRSTVWTEVAPPRRTDLSAGVAAVLREMRELQQSGRLPA